MNRFQYHNAVTDLFDLRRAVFSLPERVARVYADYFDPAKGKLPETIGVGNRPLGKSQLIEPRLAGVAPFPQDLRAEHGFDTQGRPPVVITITHGIFPFSRSVDCAEQRLYKKECWYLE